MTESRRASWAVPALILLTTFLAPMAYVDVQYVFQVREIWLLFPWQPFMLWTNRVIFYPGFPSRLPSDPDLVRELVLIWVAIGAVLSLLFPRDLEEFRHSISLRNPSRAAEQIVCQRLKQQDQVERKETWLTLSS